MKVKIKKHGLNWFDSNSDLVCPECDIEDYERFDWEITKVQSVSYKAEITCLNCGCEFEIEKSIREINDETPLPDPDNFRPPR